MGKKQYTFEKAVKRYNDMMFDLGLEFLTIGTNYSEDTDNWNIRDLVAEADYQLSCYFEAGMSQEEMRDSEDEYERKRWRSEVGKFTRFINYYKPYIEGVRCTQGHCSQYDNHRG